MITFTDISLLFLLGMMGFFLLHESARTRGKRVYANVADAKTDLDRWEAEHQGINPGHYPNGRRLAEAYRRALLDLFETAPEERGNPEYTIEFMRISMILDLKQDRVSTFHTTA